LTGQFPQAVSIEGYAEKLMILIESSIIMIFVEWRRRGWFSKEEGAASG